MQSKSSAQRWLRGLIGGALLWGAALACQASAHDPNNPTGTHGLLLVDKKGAMIHFADPVTHAELATFAVDRNPHELAISPDHTRGYVTIYGKGVYESNLEPGHTVLVLDLKRHTILDSIDVSPYSAPHGIMVDAHGLLYVTCDRMRKLLIIDPRSKKILDAIDTEGTGHFFVLLPDASKAYVSPKFDRDYISVIDLKRRQISARVPISGGAEGITVSPDGKRVIAIAHRTPTLLVIDPRTDQIIDRVTVDGFPLLGDDINHLMRVRFSPDGSKVLASNYPSSLVSVIDAHDLHRQTLLSVPKGPMGFAFAADGKSALVSEQDAGVISIIDLTGTPHISGQFKLGVGNETLSYY